MYKIITLIKRRLIGFKPHLDKHIYTIVMAVKQLTYIISYYLGTIAAGKSFSNKHVVMREEHLKQNNHCIDINQ